MTTDTDGTTEEQPAPATGDTVRLIDPYTTLKGGVYTHGIVTEIVAHKHGPNSDPRSVGVLPFNPRSNSLYLKQPGNGSRGVPETVDVNTSELVVVEQAEGGYANEDPVAQAFAQATGGLEQFLSQSDLLLPRCPRARWQQMQPFIRAAKEAGGLRKAQFLGGDGVSAPVIVLDSKQGNGAGDMVVDAATRMGFEIASRDESPDFTRYYLRDPAVDAAYTDHNAETGNTNGLEANSGP